LRFFSETFEYQPGAKKAWENTPNIVQIDMLLISKGSGELLAEMSQLASLSDLSFPGGLSGSIPNLAAAFSADV
jgi:hypothetical protein